MLPGDDNPGYPDADARAVAENSAEQGEPMKTS